MRKKKQKLTRISNSTSDGFNNLIDIHTQALEKNSFKIAQALKALSKKKLSYNQKEELRILKDTLKKIDKNIDKL